MDNRVLHSVMDLGPLLLQRIKSQRSGGRHDEVNNSEILNLAKMKQQIIQLYILRKML